MKLIQLTIATAAAALLGGAAYAQQPAAPTPGSVTGDWNGAHAPSDDKQYQEKVKVPLAEPAASSEATISATTTTEPAPAPAPAATTAGADVAASTFTNITVTNGPVPDTAENRAKYGQPMSRAGKLTAAKGN